MKRILTLCVALVATLSVSAAPRFEQQTPLYIVDGKAVSADEVKRIAATDIESMTVLRDAQQVARFSHFGDTSNGVIVITLKDTSLLAVIGFAELTYQAQQIYAVNFRTAEVLLIVGALYFIVITLLTKLADVLDKRFNK